MCGHRSAYDHLTDDYVPLFIAWKLAKGNYQEWRWILETQDDFEILEGFAMIRTDLYLSLEKTGD